MTIAKILPFVVMLALVALYLPNKDAVSVDSILRYTPDNLVAGRPGGAGRAYAVKSLSVFFPLLVLYAAAGLLFPLPAALLVNLSGLLVCVTVPYGIGRFAGKDLVDSLQKKYKKIARINEIKRGSELFFAFFLRIIAVLPGDVVSMVLGASGHDLLEVRRGIPVRAAAGHGGRPPSPAPPCPIPPPRCSSSRRCWWCFCRWDLSSSGGWSAGKTRVPVRKPDPEQ